MLIKDLPEPIRKLVEQRRYEYYKKHGILDLYNEKLKCESVDEFNFDVVKEGFDFWYQISNGNFTPYYDIYGIPDKGYPEITLSDGIAANPEKKEETEELINGNNIPIQEAEAPQFDPITKPKHYNSHPSGIECIEITQHHNYCIGNSIKYLWRQGLKDGESNIKDLMKARKCIDLEIERIKKFENSGK